MFDKADWKKLEDALGRTLGMKERDAISDLTEEFLSFRTQEGDNVPTVREVSARIKSIRTKAEDLRSDLAIDWDVISAHNTPAAHAVISISRNKDGDGTLVAQLQAALNEVIDSCDQAMERQPQTRSTGYQVGFSWKHAVKMMHILLYPEHPPGGGIGKNADTGSGPFVRFIDAWQDFLPEDARNHSLEAQPEALQSAVDRAVRGKK
ncbi:hypothetical protein [uncultured Methylobacterium sp.]|uniref:hypothetical protein n=1 Tax=uncultured Methylobacterium sp. TaxID=157278 RepID=UPI0035CC365D